MIRLPLLRLGVGNGGRNTHPQPRDVLVFGPYLQRPPPNLPEFLGARLSARPLAELQRQPLAMGVVPLMLACSQGFSFDRTARSPVACGLFQVMRNTAARAYPAFSNPAAMAVSSRPTSGRAGCNSSLACRHDSGALSPTLRPTTPTGTECNLLVCGQGLPEELFIDSIRIRTPRGKTRYRDHAMYQRSDNSIAANNCESRRPFAP